MLRVSVLGVPLLGIGIVSFTLDALPEPRSRAACLAERPPEVDARWEWANTWLERQLHLPPSPRAPIPSAPRSTSIVGRVVDRDGRPRAGRDLNLVAWDTRNQRAGSARSGIESFPPPHLVASCQTDAKGRFEFHGLALRRYAIQGAEGVLDREGPFLTADPVAPGHEELVLDDDRHWHAIRLRDSGSERAAVSPLRRERATTGPEDVPYVFCVALASDGLPAPPRPADGVGPAREDAAEIGFPVVPGRDVVAGVFSLATGLQKRRLSITPGDFRTVSVFDLVPAAAPATLVLDPDEADGSDDLGRAFVRLLEPDYAIPIAEWIHDFDEGPFHGTFAPGRYRVAVEPSPLHIGRGDATAPARLGKYATTIQLAPGATMVVAPVLRPAGELALAVSIPKRRGMRSTSRENAFRTLVLDGGVASARPHPLASLEQAIDAPLWVRLDRGIAQEWTRCGSAENQELEAALVALTPGSHSISLRAPGLPLTRLTFEVRAETTTAMWVQLGELWPTVLTGTLHPHGR